MGNAPTTVVVAAWAALALRPANDVASKSRLYPALPASLISPISRVGMSTRLGVLRLP